MASQTDLDATDQTPHAGVLYRHRFSAGELAAKDRIWQVLCERVFQRYIRPTDTVLDVASGHGEFSRHIRAGRLIAIDLNPELATFVPPHATFRCTGADALDFLADGTVDVAFASNFLEHLPSKAVVDRVLSEILRVLKPGGLFVAMQPNIRYAYREYWDFYDHHTALSHSSCAEAFMQAGFAVTELIPRFMPFSVKSGLPTHPFFVRAYLAVPLLWRVFGKQFLIVGRKAENGKL